VLIFNSGVVDRPPLAVRLPHSHSLTPLLNWMAGDNRLQRVMGQDKDREVTYLLLSQAKQGQTEQD